MVALACKLVGGFARGVQLAVERFELAGPRCGLLARRGHLTAAGFQLGTQVRQSAGVRAQLGARLSELARARVDLRASGLQLGACAIELGG